MRWKQECKEMDAHVGSGIIVTAPLITEDGKPISDPLVLQQSAPGQAFHTAPSGQGTLGADELSQSQQPLEKPVIDWKLTLHQIGACSSLPLVTSDTLVINGYMNYSNVVVWNMYHCSISYLILSYLGYYSRVALD
jgi:hypothetical protein